MIKQEYHKKFEEVILCGEIDCRMDCCIVGAVGASLGSCGLQTPRHKDLCIADYAEHSEH